MGAHHALVLSTLVSATQQCAVTAVSVPAYGHVMQDIDGSKEEVAPLVQQLLQDKAALLQECFAIEITSKGLLASLPQLIEGHCPDLNRLPHFVLQLARDVDWENEQECFRGLAQVSLVFVASAKCVVLV